MRREGDSDKPEILDPHEIAMVEIKEGFILAIVILLIILVIYFFIT